MPFNSIAFLAGFLPLVALIARALIARERIGAFQWWMAGASLFFYAWGEPRYLPLLVASIVFNWWVVGRLATASDKVRLPLLWVGIGINLLALFSFKYLSFFAGILALVGVPTGQGGPTHFPLGLSFFIIQQIMLLVDAYEGLVPSYRFREASSFVAFFPYLLLGPISRARQILPQLAKPDLTRFKVSEALALIAIGLAKKVLLADNLAVFVNQAYSTGPEWPILQAWLVAIAYGLQLYFDFCGYTDMALGSAKLVGIAVPRNFNAPFRARSVAEFWQRWHMTLTQFINTYLFTPIVRRLGKVTLFTSAIATTISMLIAGLWHGPSWNFVVFGGMHGLALCANQYTKKKKIRFNPVVAHAATLLFLIVGFIVFRAPTLSFAITATNGLVGSHGWSMQVAWPAELPAQYGLLVLLVSIIAAFAGPTSEEWAVKISGHQNRLPIIIAVSAAAIAVMLSVGKSQFVYNQF